MLNEFTSINISTNNASIQLLPISNLDEVQKAHTNSETNTVLAELTTYFAIFVWGSLHVVVCVANMGKDGGVATKTHHASEACTSEPHHPAVLSLIQ